MREVSVLDVSAKRASGVRYTCNEDASVPSALCNPVESLKHLGFC